MYADQIFAEGRFTCPKCGSNAFRELWMGNRSGDELIGVECKDCGTFYHNRNYFWGSFHKPVSEHDDFINIPD